MEPTGEIRTREFLGLENKIQKRLLGFALLLVAAVTTTFLYSLQLLQRVLEKSSKLLKLWPI